MDPSGILSNFNKAQPQLKLRLTTDFMAKRNTRGITFAHKEIPVWVVHRNSEPPHRGKTTYICKVEKKKRNNTGQSDSDTDVTKYDQIECFYFLSS